jgi:hypothetical protein
VSEDFLQDENLRSLMDRRLQHLCTIPLLEALLLKELNFWCCLGDGSSDATRNTSL